MFKIKQKTQFNSIWLILITLFLCLIFSFSAYTPVSVVSAADTEIVYTDVLEDLKKDENFNSEDYPVIETDYSLKVIQIAESSDNELFIYVYQPSTKEEFHATSISFSTTVNEDFSPNLYKLNLVSANGTLTKYVVKDFDVLSDQLRYYSFVSIFRLYVEDVDTPSVEDQTVHEVSYEIGSLWIASTVDDEVTYTVTKTEVVEITDKYVGFIRYLNGYLFGQHSCDSHFVAFSTDLPIDKLFEVEVFYSAESGQGTEGGYNSSWWPDNSYSSKVVWKAGDVGFSESWGVFGHSYSWNRIQSAQDFVSDSDLNPLDETAKANILSKQWVVRFLDTDYTRDLTGSLYRYSATRITDVSILRLKFEMNSEVYNLGVVDNLQSGPVDPSGEVKPSSFGSIGKFFKGLGIALGIALLIIILIVLIPFYPAIFKFIFVIFKYIGLAIWYVFKGLWWLITWPFRIFKEKGGK